MFGLGGNFPETLEAFRRVRSRVPEVFLRPQMSSLYRSRPRDDEDQDPFWNAAVAAETDRTALEVLDLLQTWESEAGRVRDPARPKGPRVLDLDLLVFGTETLRHPRLTVPHPRLIQRAFALGPLVEVLGGGGDPLDLRRWQRALAALPDQGVDRLGREW